MIEEIFLISTNIVRLIVFLVVPIILYFKDEKRLVTYLISLAFVLIIIYGLKYGLGIPRPEEAAFDVMTPRFPSGHTSLAFLPILFFKSWRYRFPLLIYAIFVAYLRIHLDLHVFIDIFASIFITISIAVLFLRFKEEVYQKFDTLLRKIK